MKNSEGGFDCWLNTAEERSNKETDQKKQCRKLQREHKDGHFTGKKMNVVDRK